MTTPAFASSSFPSAPWTTRTLAAWVVAVALPAAPGALQFGTGQTLSSSSGYDAVVADLDGDGDQDVLRGSTATPDVGWFENLDGQGTFAAVATIALSGGSPAYSVAAEDLDADGDLDVVAGFFGLGADRIVWYENLDGLGTFGAENVITTAVATPRVRTADLDGDGDPDVLAASSGDGRITWYENVDGLGSFGPQLVIDSTPSSGPRDPDAADLDGDGDLDVLVARRDANQVNWYENTDGQGSFGPGQPVLDCASPQAVQAVDMDLDGDLDALTGCSQELVWVNQVTWRANSDGLGTFVPGGLVSQLPGNSGVNAVAADDLDVDGDPDVVYTQTSPSQDVIAYLNDGAGTFSYLEHLAQSQSLLRALATGDLDGDGDPDAVVVSSTVTWYPYLGCTAPQAAAETIAPGSPPNPLALLPGQTSGPVLGATWDPVVDHSSFLPGATLDVLGITDSYAFAVIEGVGTLVLNPPGASFLLQYTTAAGTPFAVAIPNIPCLAGVRVFAQAASVDGSTVLLTNGIQADIGNF